MQGMQNEESNDVEQSVDEKAGQREQGGICRKHWRQLDKPSLLMVRSCYCKSLQGGGGQEAEEEGTELMFGS